MRINEIYREKEIRMKDYCEVEKRLSKEEVKQQASICMACGIPFCHGSGCPLGNVIPEFNAAIANGKELLAYQILSETSFFPEFTSSVCPALCEGSCTNGIEEEPVMIRQTEKYIIETAYSNGWVKPVLPSVRNGIRIAVIGSGPSGLYVAEALNRKGFSVTVYEKDQKPGGLLRYGIPDFKLAKNKIDRRLEVMKAAGIKFVTSTRIGDDISGEYIRRNFDAVVLATGTPEARDLKIPGREWKGIHFALEFLKGQTRVNSGELPELPISAKGKNVLVIGGGDTGSDCVGSALRQGANSVMQIELMPKPPVERSPSTPWPAWPYLLRTSSSQKEGGERRWELSSTRFLEKNGTVSGVEVCSVKWNLSPLGRPLDFKPVDGSQEVLNTDLVLLAMGFLGTAPQALTNSLKIPISKRMTLQPVPENKIFVTGDAANGASLVVRAMADAKRVADEIEASFR